MSEGIQRFWSLFKNRAGNLWYLAYDCKCKNLNKAKQFSAFSHNLNIWMNPCVLWALKSLQDTCWTLVTITKQKSKMAVAHFIYLLFHMHKSEKYTFKPMTLCHCQSISNVWEIWKTGRSNERLMEINSHSSPTSPFTDRVSMPYFKRRKLL